MSTRFNRYNNYKRCDVDFQIVELSMNGQKLLARVESSPKPVVAAIMGTCLGGGLEVCIPALSVRQDPYRCTFDL